MNCEWRDARIPYPPKTDTALQPQHATPHIFFFPLLIGTRALSPYVALANTKEVAGAGEYPTDSKPISRKTTQPNATAEGITGASY
jgi:hypothetical protein